MNDLYEAICEGQTYNPDQSDDEDGDGEDGGNGFGAGGAFALLKRGTAFVSFPSSLIALYFLYVSHP